MNARIVTVATLSSTPPLTSPSRPVNAFSARLHCAAVIAPWRETSKTSNIVARSSSVKWFTGVPLAFNRSNRSTKNGFTSSGLATMSAAVIPSTIATTLCSVRYACASSTGSTPGFSPDMMQNSQNASKSTVS
eukprot:31310-Pelagococcus_subviridis.AAC.17